MEFGEDVAVDTAGGAPRIELDTGAAAARYAVYNASASSARTLAFSYEVQAGDDTADLDYAAAAAILPSGGTIRDAALNNANLSLPSPGTDGLIDPGTIRLDGIRPEVLSVSSEKGDGPYNAGSAIDVRVTFDEIVVVGNASGTPSVRLETGTTDRNATFTGEGSNSTTLVFLYTVQDGDETGDLNYTGTAAMSENGGTIRDRAGNDAETDLPSWGDGNTLGERKDIVIDTLPPEVLSAEAEFLDRIRVTFDGPVASGAANASAGWSISGPSAGGLSVAAPGPVPANAPLTEIVLVLDGHLPDTSPVLALSYDADAGSIADEAGNALQDLDGANVSDRVRPRIDEALITGPREMRIDYTEPVAASQGAYSDLVIGGDARAIGPYDTASSLRGHVLGFAGAEAPVPEPPSTIRIDGRAVRDGADPPNLLGDGPSTVDVLDGRVLDVHSSRIAGPDTAVITYTRSAAAQQGDYASLVVDGRPRSIAGLDGGGGHTHTLTFSPGGAPPNATGSVEIDAAAVAAAAGSNMRLGNGTIERALADGQSPSVRSATAVSPDTIRVEFDEPVADPDADGAAAAAGWSISGRDAAGLAVAASGRGAAGPPDALELVLDGPLPDTAPDAVTVSYRPAAGSVEDAAGNGLVASSTSVADGIAPKVGSAAVAGPNEAEVRYTEPVWASPGAYVSVALSPGGIRPVTGLAGNGTAAHTVTFGGDAAGPGTTGALEIDAASIRDAALLPLGLGGTIAINLTDGKPPSVRSATAVSPDAIRVEFDEPVSAPGADGAAAGWSISGRDAAGLAVASARGSAGPSDALELVLSGPLPDTAPDAVLAYDPASGAIVDVTGNVLAALSTSIADGLAPLVMSAFVAGPSEAEVRYTEPVWASPGAYASVALSSGGDPRPVSGLAGNGTAAHTVTFGGGDAAVPGTTGVLEADAASIRDAAGLALGSDSMLRLVLAAEAPQARPGSASASAAFTARNTVTITYSDALGPPAGHDGPVYASVAIDGEEGDGARPVSGVSGLGTAVHTVSFGGDGVGRNRTGTIALAVGLEGAGGEGGADPPRFAAGPIPVASGLAARTVLVAQAPQGQPSPPPVRIDSDGFVRAVDGTAAGAAARLAINVTGLAAAGGGAAAPEPGTVLFPDEAVTLTASFAEVAFPPGATAMQVPAGGAIYLYVAGGTPPAGVAAALDYPGAGRLVLGTIVEAGAENSTIVFDRPVRISLDGQAGGRAFYIGGAAGSASPIDLACAADDLERVHRQLGGSGECRIEPGGGDMVIYTYHLTRFGTVASEDGAPPPVLRTCSVRLGAGELRAEASPGGVSTAAAQGVDNSGSEPFDRVGLAATPWYIDPASDRPGPGAPSLPASLTAVREAGRAGGFELAAGGAEIAQGLGGGLNTTLWFQLDLTEHGSVNASRLVQHVTYTAMCGG